MGAANSKIEEDKVLQLCRERKKFVKQALNGRCSVAAAHVAYIQSLKNTGTALKKFLEPEAPIESSLYTSTNATPEPLALTEKSISHFSFSSPSPSPPNSSNFQANHMKFSGTTYKKVEEKLSLPVIQTVTSSERPEISTFEDSSVPSETAQWDYFGFFHPIDHQLSPGLDSADDLRRFREDKGIHELDDAEEEKDSFHEGEESEGSEDEFDEPPTDTLVRSFENLNRVNDDGPGDTSTESVAPKDELLDGEKNRTPSMSAAETMSLVVPLPSDPNKVHAREDCIENKVVPKDLFSSIKDIEFLFIKASDSGKEVPRMLEANKLHFHPILPGTQKHGSVASSFLKACFSCGEDSSIVQEEPAQTGVKYLIWHRTESSLSSSNPLGASAVDDKEDHFNNLFDNSCMISGSHASTLDRLYAWERKLYDEVKASEMIRREYDLKCRALRQLESKGVGAEKVNKTRAVVKDLHSRIRVAIHRIDTISKKIEELRDKELQPQLEELIEGLTRMWEVMFECHKLQFRIISVALNNGNTTKISAQPETHRQITSHLENELTSLSSSFTKWIGSQSSYLQSINGWLFKCVSLQQKSTRGKRRHQAPSLRNYGPPIYVLCGVWLEKLDSLPTREVSDSIKGLAAETARFLPRQEKNKDKGDFAANTLKDEASEDWVSGFDRFRQRLVGFFGQLNNFSESTVKMYAELDKDIQDAKRTYDQIKSQP